VKPLREIIEEIHEYQKAMGYDNAKMSPEENLQALRNYVVALMMEQAELLEEVSWKPWRKHEDQKPNPNRRKMALEWVDMLFFLVDQMLCLGLTPDEVLLAYETKLEANHKRISNGYSKVKT
jgi:hypothetical protein